MRIIVADQEPSTRSALRMLLTAQPDMDLVGEAADLVGRLALGPQPRQQGACQRSLTVRQQAHGTRLGAKIVVTHPLPDHHGCFSQPGLEGLWRDQAHGTGVRVGFIGEKTLQLTLHRILGHCHWSPSLLDNAL